MSLSSRALGQVVAERLLDDDPAPAVARGSARPVRLSCSQTSGKNFGRDRQVERVVAAGAALGVQVVRRCSASWSKASSSSNVARDEPEALGELLPDSSRNGVRACSLDRVVDDLGEVLVGPVAAGEADQREARRQQAAVGQVVDRRHQLLAGQVAGDAEDDQAARAGDPGQPPVPRVAQRVARARPRWDSCSSYWRGRVGRACRPAGPIPRRSVRCSRSTGGRGRRAPARRRRPGPR